MDERTLSLSRAAQAVTAAVFCLFLAGLGLAHVLLPDRARSETENRTLAQRPELTWSALADGSFTKAAGLRRRAGDLSGGPVSRPGRLDGDEDPV